MVTTLLDYDASRRQWPNTDTLWQLATFHFSFWFVIQSAMGLSTPRQPLGWSCRVFECRQSSWMVVSCVRCAQELCVSFRLFTRTSAGTLFNDWNCKSGIVYYVSLNNVETVCPNVWIYLLQTSLQEHTSLFVMDLELCAFEIVLMLYGQFSVA